MEKKIKLFNSINKRLNSHRKKDNLRMYPIKECIPQIHELIHEIAKDVISPGKGIIYPKSNTHIKSDFKPIAGLLAKLTSVDIDNTKVLNDYNEPTRTYTITGDRYLVMICANLIDYAYYRIDEIVNIQSKKHKVRAKLHRKKNRKKAIPLPKLVDTRVFASNYRKKLLSDMYSIVESSLEDDEKLQKDRKLIKKQCKTSIYS